MLFDALLRITGHSYCIVFSERIWDVFFCCFFFERRAHPESTYNPVITNLLLGKRTLLIDVNVDIRTFRLQRVELIISTFVLLVVNGTGFLRLLFLPNCFQVNIKD